MPHIGTTIPQMLEELWTPLLTKKKKKLKKQKKTKNLYLRLVELIKGHQKSRNVSIGEGLSF